MNFYKIITDEQKLKDFIDWLPDLRDNEKYYLSLFARKKYSPNLIKSNDKTQLKRFLSDKERMFDKIAQLEIPLGRWKLKGMSAPQESLVLYINPNPRDMKKATEMIGKKSWDLMKNKNYNLVAETMSCVQKSKARGVYVHFDIDTEGEFDMGFIQKLFPLGGYTVLKTRGGYHLLVNPEKIYSLEKKWFELISIHYNVDKQDNTDLMLPIPGCVQGGFTPYFLETPKPIF